MKKWVLLFLLAFLPLSAKTQITFWHAFEGFLLQQFAEVVSDFNHQSKDYEVVLVFKGNYNETFQAGIDAIEAGQPPHILQVYEVATQTMLLKPTLYRPVDELMRHYFKKFDHDIYIDAVRDFYSNPEGRMCSLPWNASTGILFYNKDAFKAVGLDPECPPKTWEELEGYCVKLNNAGYKGFVTAWPAAYHLEHVCARHDLSFATQRNGYDGLAARLNFNKDPQVRHLSKLVSWQQLGIFSYQGRLVDKPEKHFTDGKSAILLQGANRFAMLKKASQAPIGVGFLPYWADVVDEPLRLNIGGSSFWAISGFEEDTYRGIAHFFSYLSQAEVQADWHQKTGYLPITEAAYYFTKKKGFYASNPAAEIAVLEIMNTKSTANSNGVRLGNYTIVREKIIDYLEKAFAEEMSPQEALDKAVEEGNRVLADFEKSQAH